MWIDIEQVDLDRLATALSVSLNTWIAPENSIKHEVANEKTTLTPLFIMQVASHLEIALGLSIESQKKVAVAGYACGYPRYRWSPDIYENIADSISFDTLAGDYPIYKVDFSTLGKITWIGESAHTETRAKSIDEFLHFYNDLNTQSRQKVWLNNHFISSQREDLGLRAWKAKQ